jgi:hypothetical protein
MYNVAYRPVTKRWLCKQRPLISNARNMYVRNSRTTTLCSRFLDNGLVNTPLQQWSYCWKRCFLFGPCKMVIRKTIGDPVSWGLTVQLSSARDSEKRWCYNSVVSWKSACEKKTRKLVWNGRQPVTQSVSWELKVRLWRKELVPRVRLWKEDFMCAVVTVRLL